MRNFERRHFLSNVAMASVFTLAPKLTSAQRLNQSDLAEILKSDWTRYRVVRGIDFAISGLQLSYIESSRNKIQSYEDLAEQFGQDWRSELTDLYSYLIDFRDGKFNSRYLGILDKSSDDEILKRRRIAINLAKPLVNNTLSYLNQSILSPDDLAAEVISNSIFTIEQFNMLERGVDSKSSFLCGYFPFTFFCN